MQDNMTNKKTLIFKPGKNVKLTARAEYFSSIIADGVELIPEEGRHGMIIVPELKCPEVYVSFKEDVTDVSCAFYECHRLQEIPADLFANCPNITSFEETFYDCTSLQTIPATLFDNNKKVSCFRSAFCWCIHLVSVPEDLFANCPDVTDFYGTFSCTGIISIPAGLFAKNKKATNFSRTFSQCNNLLFIPSELFISCSRMEEYCGVFSHCGDLCSLPNGLFANNPKVTKMSFAFYGSSHLRFSPEELYLKLKTPLKDEVVQSVSNTKKKNTQDNSSFSEEQSEKVCTSITLDMELMQRVKYIALAEGSSIKEKVTEGLIAIVENWEAQNGKIEL